jgi:hypothetical protein
MQPDLEKIKPDGIYVEILEITRRKNLLQGLVNLPALETERSRRWPPFSHYISN